MIAWFGYCRNRFCPVDYWESEVLGHPDCCRKAGSVHFIERFGYCRKTGSVQLIARRANCWAALMLQESRFCSRQLRCRRASAASAVDCCRGLIGETRTAQLVESNDTSSAGRLGCCCTVSCAAAVQPSVCRDAAVLCLVFLLYSNSVLFCCCTATSVLCC